MFDYEFLIEDQDNNIRIDQFLNEELEDLSRSYLQKLIKNENIKVNNKSIKPNYKLRIGDYVTIIIPEPEQLKIEAENIPLDIVYDDNDIAIVNKPQGMVVHPAPGHYSGTLVNALLYHFNDSLSGINGIKRPGIVHRIDKDTSGLLIICKNDNSHQKIAEQLKDHSITRKYHAVCYNNIKSDTGTVEGPIGRHPTNRKKMSINYKNGKNAITHYKVLERFGQLTYIQAELETGRTHQIRVHMSSIGHPLLGDEVYGPNSKIGKSFKLCGQVLHAKVIGFIHPTSGKYMEFESDLPEYFQNVLNELRKAL